ncbi:MAG TPA: ferrous iron transport protein B [Longimicrobiales bacterium]|nr:ferrous iron transport protein B [Longimicrobiales bacterium]
MRWRVVCVCGGRRRRRRTEGSAVAVKSPSGGAPATGKSRRVEGGADRTGPLVALIGPPNSGKSTLFNQLTGLRQKVANYPGVTVEKHLGTARLPTGGVVTLVDLPGVNGFAARTLDEQVTRDVLEGRVPDLPVPDALILTVDSTRLESQLMLVEPVLSLGLPTLLVLNMSDELESRGGSLDAESLGEQLGVEVVRANARAGIGVAKVQDFLARIAAHEVEPARHRKPGPPKPMPRRIELPVVDVFVTRRGRIRVIGQQAKFRAPLPSKLTEQLDHIFLHKWLGPVFFVLIGALVFQAIFTWATPLIDGVDALVTLSGDAMRTVLPDTWIESLLIDGIWAGVGAVIVFLPQILILFLFLGLLEDSGYMARAAFIADRMMYRVGLQGRAFLPLLSGYACAVPAILAARTVEDERDRMATIFVVPFMTCSARLPVYALLIAAFIPNRPLLGPVFGTQAAVLLGLYALGAAAAIGTAWLLKGTLLKGKSKPFLMELPPYRVPTLRSVALRLYDRAKIFMKRVARIIFTVAILLWALTQFPRVDGAPPDIEQSALATIGHVIEPVVAPFGWDWKIGVGIVSSLAAREVIVGTLGTIYGVEDASETSPELRDRLQSELSFGAAIALLVFFAFALQCVSTIAVMRKETGGWKWPALQFSYMLVLAFAGAFVASRLF